MSFQEIVNNCKEIVTKKYFCFEGRAGQKEFWLWVLVTFIVGAVLGVIPHAGRILSTIFGLAVLLPSLSVAARRLHDTGKSAWLLLLELIPIIGGIIILILCIPEGQKEANAYGRAAAAK